MSGLITGKKFFIKTYGCQMNVYDSHRTSDILYTYGLVAASTIEDADIVVINTCHIREKATEKVFSELGRLRFNKYQLMKQHGRYMVIAVLGCIAQAGGAEVFKRAPFVDIVVGPTAYHELPKMIEGVFSNGNRCIHLDFKANEKFDFLAQENIKLRSKTSTFVAIQEGCDKFCTFCVVPYTRGPEFSRSVEQICDEIQCHANNGTREVILLGQNVNAFHGNDKYGKTWNLAQLIIRIAKIDSIDRIKYITSHPRDMSDDLIELHGKEPKLAPILNLPVQSGSDKILNLMNRQYSAASYMKIVQKMRSARPSVIFSSDFIVGFPGETDADFEATMNLVRDVRFEAQSFYFKYSAREGTPASLKEQIPESIKTERLAVLQNLLESQRHNFNQCMIGKKVQILTDGDTSTNYINGRTEFGQFAIIDASNLINRNHFQNTILEATVTKIQAGNLLCAL